MATQTMGSNGGAGKAVLDTLSRQASLYNLTLDEVQQQLGDLGKPFSSMNLDELLKSVHTAEASQRMTLGPSTYTEFGQFGSDVTKKTVDEVWQDIQQGQQMQNNTVDAGAGNDGSFKRQQTLGEMTLEDFLIRAGVIENDKKTQEQQQQEQQQQNAEKQEIQWVNYQNPAIQQQNMMMAGHYQVPNPLTITPNPMMDMGYASPVPYMGGVADRQMYARKRYASDEGIDKSVERRQKRMIKNRESAARSRARKQAYTHELENKVSRLEEEIERLKREKKKENVLPLVPPPQPKHQLRRTSSAPAPF